MARFYSLTQHESTPLLVKRWIPFLRTLNPKCGKSGPLPRLAPTCEARRPRMAKPETEALWRDCCQREAAEHLTASERDLSATVVTR